MSATATETQPTTTNPCNKTFSRKVKGGAIKQYRCTKPKGHDTGDNKSAHGLVRAPKTVNVPLGALESFETVPETEFVSLTNRERSAEQRTVDAHVREAHQSWIAAGRPKLAKDSPRKRYLIAAEHVEGVRTMIRRGAEFLNVRAQIAPPVKHESGAMSIQFRVTDKPKNEKPSEILADSKS